jgi:hypothetical protein
MQDLLAEVFFGNQLKETDANMRSYLDENPLYTLEQKVAYANKILNASGIKMAGSSDTELKREFIKKSGIIHHIEDVRAKILDKFEEAAPKIKASRIKLSEWFDSEEGRATLMGQNDQMGPATNREMQQIKSALYNDVNAFYIDKIVADALNEVVQENGLREKFTNRINVPKGQPLFTYLFTSNQLAISETAFYDEIKSGGGDIKKTLEKYYQSEYGGFDYVVAKTKAKLKQKQYKIERLGID